MKFTVASIRWVRVPVGRSVRRLFVRTFGWQAWIDCCAKSAALTDSPAAMRNIGRWLSCSVSSLLLLTPAVRARAACSVMSSRSVTILVFIAGLLTTEATLRLPNTSGIDGQLTANLGVDHFFSLWLVFNNEEVQMSGKKIRNRFKRALR